MMTMPAPALQTRLEVEKEELVRIMGPARVSVVEGCVRVLGIDLCRGSSILINRYRSYCLKAIEKSVLNISIGEGGSVEKPKHDEEFVDLWEIAALNIARAGGVVVVLGGIESGKTSFSTLVANVAIDLGRKPCIVDADVGQGDLAPPTFIGMKCLDRKILWLREEKGDHLKFVGFLTPSHYVAMSRIVSGVTEFVHRARSLGRDLIVVNTDGWFGDSNSIEYKLVIIKSLVPTSVVLLGQEFCSVFKTMLKNTNINLYCLPKPKVVRERSRDDRRDLRRYNYQKWFENAKRVCLDMDSIALSGMCALGGTPMSSEEIAELEKTLGVRVLHASRYSDLDVIVMPDDAMVPKDLLEHLGASRRLFIVKPSNAKGLVAAIVDENLDELGAAIVDEVDFVAKRICVYTNYLGVVKGLMIGKVKLDDQWYDFTRHPKCLI